MATVLLESKAVDRFLRSTLAKSCFCPDSRIWGELDFKGIKALGSDTEPKFSGVSVEAFRPPTSICGIDS